MNCEQFRELYDATPNEDFDGREAHLADCEHCRGYVASGLTFEATLKAALEVPVPDFALPDVSAQPGGAAVVDLATRRDRPTQTASSGRPLTWLALAASVALAALLGVQFAKTPSAIDPARPALVAQLLEHMEHEREEMRVKTMPAAFGTVKYVMDAADAAVADDIGLISYARSCVVNGRTIPHLVLQGKHGPITLLIMPDEPIDGPIPFSDADFDGAIVPVGRTGSVAIIGRKGEPIDDIRETIADKIRLSI